MNLYEKTRKEIGALGERVAVLYLSRHGQRKVEMNVARKTGEIDAITRTAGALHFIEVKTFAVEELPQIARVSDDYDPSGNIHEAKIRKIARTAEWYVAENDWEGEWQIDAVLVWLRKRDGAALVRYLPQIL